MQLFFGHFVDWFGNNKFFMSEGTVFLFANSIFCHICWNGHHQQTAELFVAFLVQNLACWPHDS